MAELITGDEAFAAILTDWQRTAFRLETRARYNEPVEAEPYRRWRAGQPDDFAWIAGWADSIRRQVAAGAVIQRVRVISDPPTQYQRWSLEVCRINVDAGEDIRYLQPAQLAELGVEPADWWLYDDHRVVLLRFDEQDRRLGFEALTDPETVARHRAARALLWQHATPYRELIESPRG